MKTRRLLKTKRYVGKGYRAFFGLSRKPTSSTWCRPFGDGNIQTTIKKRVSKLFRTFDSDADTIENAVIQVTTHTGVFEDRADINYTVAGFVNDQTPLIINEQRHPGLSIRLPNGTRNGDVCVIKFMQYDMINLRKSALNIITKIRNDKRFRSSYDVCRKRGETRSILNENDSKATIVDAIINYLQISRSEAFTGNDTRLTKYKARVFLTSTFTYEQLKQYILGLNEEMYVTNNSMLIRIRQAAAEALAALAENPNVGNAQGNAQGNAEPEQGMLRQIWNALGEMQPEGAAI